MPEFAFPLLVTSAAINIILAAVILSRATRNAPTFLFAAIAASSSFWSAGIIGFYISNTQALFGIPWVTITHLGGLIVPFFFVLFAARFPERQYHTPASLVSVFILCALTWALFAGGSITQATGIASYIVGPLYLLYVAGVSGLFLLGYLLLVRQLAKAKNKATYNQILTVLIGSALASVLAMGPDLILPLFGRYSLTWLGPLFTLIMVISLFVAMQRYRLFSVKILLAELFSGTIIMLLILDFVNTTETAQLVQGGIVLLLVVVASYFLTNSVQREVQARAQIEELATNLASANERLRELDRQKSEFLSIASHQLRTPLAAVKGYASMLLEDTYGALSEEARKPLESIFTSSSRMADTVEDFLNVSRIEQGKMEYRMKHDDLHTLVESITTDLTLAAKEKGLTLTYTKDSDGPYTVCMDASKLTHVISNLIDNAIKYTPRGSVMVHLKKEGASAVVTVSDTGAGIPKDSLHTLFDKFVRARNANEVNVTGTGLGLYVARQMIQAHEGTITASSEGEGKGSTFTVRLPLVA